MKKFFTSVAIITATISLSSCSKFEDGGFISKADTRISETWLLDKYYRNGNEETSTLYIKNLKEVYDDNGTLTRSYTGKDNDAEISSGKWTLTSDQKEVKIDGTSSVGDFSTNTNSVSSSTYTIIRLMGDDYWYKYTNGSDVHEFHFLKQ